MDTCRPPTPPVRRRCRCDRRTNPSLDVGLQVTVRAMSIYKFMNSKVLFKDVRHRAEAEAPGMPVMVHISE